MVYTFDTVDVKEYIASGILESVVIGLASDQEMKEVACLSHIYPEIKEELSAIEKRYESYALDAAITPEPDLRQTILDAIKQTPQMAKEGPNEELAKVIPLNRSAANPWKFIAAASLILTLGLGALWYNSFSEMKQTAAEMAEIQAQNTKNRQFIMAMSVEQERMKAIQEVLEDGNIRKVMMMGTPMEPKAAVRVMWSKESRKAVMVAEKIIPPPVNMQYQLWAIADGVPVSLGVFDYDELDRMTEPFAVNADHISAFAITLEKMGGNPTPTMDKMVVKGPISS